ncbi:DNA polymerase/3'-5' exonuclease PolX [Saccharomonospora iraqiensis]|uniref:DNA polymerase/3'-5' exonuclease PolX n=1 Tax=Saccharomonospora iraqiensis TaxID=52698 RepID=UPI00041A06B5|nr:DNA polymerase/3'-5' exonuclease PolX [Saccharomonospora iraqiensis]
MPRRNDEVAALLQEYADLLSISGGEAFKVRVYEKAARAVAGHHADVSGLDADELRAVPGVGSSIAKKVDEYLRTGRVAALERLRGRIPAGVRALTEIPTLGPRKAMQIHTELGVSSVDELERALDEERVRELKGFGPRTEENLRRGIDVLRQSEGRVHLDVALSVAEEVTAALREVTGCVDCAWAGSLRRMRETVGDVDVLASAEDSAPLMAAFVELPQVAEVLAHGTTKTSVRTHKGLQVDLRVVRAQAWGAALQYFTGSKAHNIRTRGIAVRHGWKLSEYGLFDADTDELVVSRTEEDVYARLGLPWIPPPLREDRGEIEAAQEGTLPELVTADDIRGDLHTHTDLTDGVSPLEDMVHAAARRGLSYYAVTDHAPDLPMQRMSDDKMLAQRERVRALQGAVRGMRLLHGTELNIGPDGGLDWPDEFLRGFDVCVASVHSHFDQPAEEMTRRIVRACENPYVSILGHPTTRRIGRRPPVDVDRDAVFAACARTGTALEVNSHPDRLDLSDADILRAREHGVVFAVNTDAHSTVDLDNLRYGIGTAQRGWLSADEVINTWPWRRLEAFLHRHRP